MTWKDEFIWECAANCSRLLRSLQALLYFVVSRMVGLLTSSSLECGKIPWRAPTPNQLPICCALTDSTLFKPTSNNPGPLSSWTIEPAFNLTALLLGRSVATDAYCTRWPSKSYTVGGQLQATDRVLSPASVRNSMLHDHCGNRLLVRYNLQDEVFPIILVFKYFSSCSNRLNT